MDKLTHVDDQGRARMVDVGAKPVQRRIARATGAIHLSPSAVLVIAENRAKKGDVLGLAEVAGIQAAKRTADMIPLCHPLIIDQVQVQMHMLPQSVIATSEVRCTGRTGAEMEALTAVAVALLTVYDMCKAVDDHMRIGDIRLLEKAKHDVQDD